MPDYGKHRRRLTCGSSPAQVPDRARGRAFNPGLALLIGAILVCLTWPPPSPAQQGETTILASFPVRYVSGNSVYLASGSNAGLAQGQHLIIKRKPADQIGAEWVAIGEIEIEAVASVSAVGRIVSSIMTIAAGDVAWRTEEDIARLKALQTGEDIRKYPQVVSFNEGNPPEQEIRDSVPRPPSPEVNRIRGRIGLDYSSLSDFQSGMGSSQIGFVLRIDATRLGGTYWSLSGFHRGRIVSRNMPSDQLTLRDLINRTYQLALTYDKPGARWSAGIGRLYVPWATSLGTIDGLYLGSRFGGKTTVGGFAGTTPDPTSWNYAMHRQMAGVFVNIAGGSFESTRISSTAGVAISRLSMHPDRQFGFFENTLFYKRVFSVYSDVEVDLRNAAQMDGNSKLLLGRAYFTMRLQPHRIITFDLNGNYYQNFPTFDPRLIGTGLLDRFLFQGISSGVRLELPYRIGIYTNLGRSDRNDDMKASWNYLYGLSAGNLAGTGIRADLRYSKFDSSFGNGNYRSISLSREIGDSFRFELQGGQQDFVSSMSAQTRARFADCLASWLLGRHYMIEVGTTFYRGQVQRYNQYYLSLGYRFDFHRGGN